MRAYCTLFNALYLVRGLALLESLKRHAGDFRLYVFAMDDTSAALLESLHEPRLVVVRPAEFEDAALLAVKPGRSIAEYFWTCTSSILQHCLLARGEPECTYVDADVWLLADPEPLFAEMGECSILLTEHRYTPRHDQSELSGRYCVQFMRFRATPEGLAALGWWRERCIEWCFARREGGKFGDQKYLDDWPERFPGVHVLEHSGGGVAPWNAERYRYRAGACGPELSEPGHEWQPIVFYHFHGLRSFGVHTLCCAFGYRLGASLKHLVYRPYARELQELFRRHADRLTGRAALGVAPAASNDGHWLRGLARRIYGLPNTITLE